MAQEPQGDREHLHDHGGLEDDPFFCSTIEKLLTTDWRNRWSQPLTADEILTIGQKVFEPLFLEPPLGPVPEHLVSHWSVHRCVAEYEDQLEELDRWKSQQLGRWLNDRAGKRCHAADKVYELQVVKEKGAALEKFWFTLIEDRTDYAMLATDKT
jgi:hypothetical protein